MDERRTIVVISQVYVPDPAAVGQQVSDAAAELAARGFRVKVFTSRCGYDDPTVVYPAREIVRGVEIARLPCASFGKRSIARRMLGASLFLMQATLRALFTRKLAGLVISTSPPTCGAAALLVSIFRRVPFVYWVMDINPDQAVTMGIASERSVSVRVFHWLNRQVLRRAKSVVTLDRFMAERLQRKAELNGKLTILPPWPMEEPDEPVSHDQNPFRRAHQMCGKFVVMYSGNHSPANPIGTVIAAAEALAHRRDIVFAFVGGGIAKEEVRSAVARGAANILDLPYEPLSELKYSLSAADLHVVTLGNQGVGIVHPCKVYGAMAVGRPIVYVGPKSSHVGDILAQHDVGAHVDHGDVSALVRAIEAFAKMTPHRRQAMGALARRVVSQRLGKSVVRKEFCDIVERAMTGEVHQAGEEIAAETDALATPESDLMAA